MGDKDKTQKSKIPGYSRIPQVRTKIMDAERINLIGTTLADLSARTAALRGYL
ncbi:MAG: hypothetical protein PHH99_16570 [Pseudomonas fluorescens]|nr:hypothetical protein [Pseudomonas fluorescens]